MIGELAKATFTANVPNNTTPQAFNEVIISTPWMNNLFKYRED